MHSSVTSSALSSGRSGRNANSSAEVSLTATGAAVELGSATESIDAQLVDTAKIQIARHHDLDSISLVLDDCGRDVDRSFQDFRPHVLGTSRAIYKGGAAAPARLRRGLHRPIDRRDQHGGSEALPKM